MTKFKLLFISFIYFTQLNSQILKTSDARKLKERKLIVTLKEYPKNASTELIKEIDSLNSYLKYTVKNFWNFNTVVDTLFEKEADELMKKDKKTYCFISIEKTKVNAGFNEIYYDQLYVYSVKESIHCCLPIHNEKTNLTSVIYACKYINNTLNLLHEEKIKNMMWSFRYIIKNRKNISDKTLLIPQEYLDESVTKEWIEENYPYSFEVCKLEKVEEIINSKNSKFAVVFLLPAIITSPDHSNGNTTRSIVFRINITNAETGDFYNVSNSGLKDAILDFKQK